METNQANIKRKPVKQIAEIDIEKKKIFICQLNDNII